MISLNERLTKAENRIKALKENEAVIDFAWFGKDENRMAEAMFLGLRLKEGVSAEYFRSKYKKDPEEIYPGPLKTFSDNGLLDCSGGRIRLTAKGRALANVVMAEFLP